MVMAFIIGVSHSILMNFSKNSKMAKSKLSIASKKIFLSYSIFLYIIAVNGKKSKRNFKNF